MESAWSLAAAISRVVDNPSDILFEENDGMVKVHDFLLLVFLYTHTLPSRSLPIFLLFIVFNKGRGGPNRLGRESQAYSLTVVHRVPLMKPAILGLKYLQLSLYPK